MHDPSLSHIIRLSCSCLCLGVMSILPTNLAASTDDDVHQLRWNLKKGTTFGTVEKRRSDNELNLDGRKLSMSSEMILDSSFKVESVSRKGVATVKRTIERVRVKATDPFGRSMDFDSKDPDGSKAPAKEVEIFSALAGETISFQVDPVRGARDVKLSSKIKKALEGEQSSHLFLDGIFSEPGLKAMVRDSFVAFPEQAVSPGSTWERKVEAGAPPLSFTYLQTFKLRGDQDPKQKGAVVIGLQTAIHVPENVDGVEVLKETSSGKFLFNPATSTLAELSSRHQLILGKPQEEMTRKNSWSIQVKE